jgi:hypothetical protein
MRRISSRAWLLLLESTTFVILSAVPGVGVAADANTAPAPPQPLFDFPLHRVYIVVALMALMTCLFWLLFLWQKRIEQAGYFAHIYQDTVEDIETNRLSAPCEERWSQGAYLNEIYLRHTQRGAEWAERNKPPEPTPELRDLASALGYDYEVRELVRRISTPIPGGSVPEYGGAPSDRSFWLGTRTGNIFPSTGSVAAPGLPGLVEADQERQGKERTFSKLRADFAREADDWMNRAGACAWSWYQQDLDRAKVAAKEQAQRALNVDYSALRGRGPEFVLEFTAIVVIIFAAVILGTLDILKDQQIGTLLAAIAGYVLGKSATRTRSGEGEQQTATRPGQLELSVKTAGPAAESEKEKDAKLAEKPPSLAVS